MFEKIFPIDKKREIVPQDCVIKGNTRSLIRVILNLDRTEKAVIIGINPSSAHNAKSDTTLTKISRYLYSYGFCELVMVNLFETISTDQKGIDFRQGSNLEKYNTYFEEADAIIVAWGIENTYSFEKQHALKYLLQYSNKVYCVEDGKGNKPRHPSRMSYEDKLVYYFDKIQDKNIR